MITKIIADNAFVNSFSAIKQRRVLRHLIMPAQVRLPAFVDVIIFVDGRIVAEKNEFVGVPPESEIKFGFASQVLFQPGKPGFCPLPGIKRPVELVSPEWFVAVSKHEQRTAKLCLSAGVREKSQATVVTIRTKATGKIPRAAHLLVEFPPYQRR